MHAIGGGEYEYIIILNSLYTIIVAPRPRAVYRAAAAATARDGTDVAVYVHVLTLSLSGPAGRRPAAGSRCEQLWLMWPGGDGPPGQSRWPHQPPATRMLRPHGISRLGAAGIPPLATIEHRAGDRAEADRLLARDAS